VVTPPSAPGVPRAPLSQWGNDDLFLTEAAQAQWREGHPDAFRVLDFPDLRAEFSVHDPLAGQARKTAQWWGTVSVLTAGLGVILGSVTSALPGDWHRTLAPVYSAMVFCGGVISLWLYATSGQRYVWLAHRFWTERIRQFHFQFVLSHLDLAVRAMRDDAALTEYRKLRATAFADFKAQAKHAPERIHQLKTDVTEAQVWIDPDWAKPPKLPDGPRADLDILLDALRRLRIDVQTQYAGAKLTAHRHSPGWRAWWFGAVGDVSTGLVAACACLAGIAMIVPAFSGWHSWLWAGVGAFGALGLMARVMEQGLQTQIDHERYEWYDSAVQAAGARYAEGGLRDKIAALREMEVLAYQEMRRFIVAHLRAKFLM
jgi:hypothetical protein